MIVDYRTTCRRAVQWLSHARLSHCLPAYRYFSTRRYGVGENLEAALNAKNRSGSHKRADQRKPQSLLQLTALLVAIQYDNLG